MITIIAIVLNITIWPLVLSSSNFNYYIDEQKEENLLNKLLNESVYNKNIRPSGESAGKPTMVYLALTILNFDYIDDENLSYGVELRLSQVWNDSRLNYSGYTEDIPLGSPGYLQLKEVSRIWVPENYFANEKEDCSNREIVYNILRIFPNGTVFLSTKSFIPLKCPMDFSKYPFDTQKCSIKLCPYSLSQEQLEYHWTPYDMPLSANMAVEIVSKKNGRFSLINYSSSFETITTNTGTYKCLTATFSFQRLFYYYIINTFVPCAMMVVISCLPFWISEDFADARMSLGITTIFTLATMIYGMSQSNPQVSYVTVLNNFTGLCISYSFLALVESVVVINVHHKTRLENSKFLFSKKATVSTSSSAPEPRVSWVRRSETNPKKVVSRSCFSLKPSEQLSQAKKIDFYAKILFPLSFFSFILLLLGFNSL